jgi:hypothetical protein
MAVLSRSYAIVSKSLTLKLKYKLRMLVERNQRSFMHWPAGFWFLTCASDSFGIKLLVWTPRPIRLDRIIEVRRLNTHSC